MAYLKKLIVAVVLLCLGSQLTAEAKKHLARVAILTFEDNTGTRNYGYLPQSLTEAMDKSLQGKFEYLREDPTKSEAARQSFAVKGLYDAEQAADFCRAHGFDIVIYGSFTLDRKTREIVVTTYVSLGKKDKFRRLKERKNPTDATIFSLAEKVADDIVTEMTGVARSQSNEKNPQPETGKLELKKEEVTSWDNRRWLIAFEAGFTGSLKTENNLKNGLGAALSLRREVWARSYIGADVGYAYTKSITEDTGSGCSGGSAGSCSQPAINGQNFDALIGTGVFGYALYPGNRWRIFADLGFGTSVGSFREEVGGDKTFQTRFVMRAATGVDFLITQAISLGIGFRVTTFPGSGYDFAFAQPALRLAYAF